MDVVATLDLPDPDSTACLAARLAAVLRAGDTVLLSGEIGAGKSHFARSLIAARLTAAGAPPEDIPSPSYTLVQTYQAGALEIWHVDLYRLADPGEIAEIGLDAAFGHALVIIEWPERLPPPLIPAEATWVALAPAGTGRRATIRAAPGLAARLASAFAGCVDA